jgi:hypothetical protein
VGQTEQPLRWGAGARACQVSKRTSTSRTERAVTSSSAARARYLLEVWAAVSVGQIRGACSRYGLLCQWDR